jgi:hypothetical protein
MMNTEENTLPDHNTQHRKRWLITVRLNLMINTAVHIVFQHFLNMTINTYHRCSHIHTFRDKISRKCTANVTHEPTRDSHHYPSL